MSSGVPASLPCDRLTPNQGDATPPLAPMLLRDLPCLFSLLMVVQCLLDAFQGVTLIQSTSVSLLTKGRVREMLSYMWPSSIWFNCMLECLPLHVCMITMLHDDFIMCCLNMNMCWVYSPHLLSDFSKWLYLLQHVDTIGTTWGLSCKTNYFWNSWSPFYSEFSPLIGHAL